MSIGPDISEVLAELGSSVTVHPYIGAPIPAGFLDFEVFSQHSTIFTRMFVHAATTQYDTIIAPGDIVSWGGKYYICSNKKPVDFEDTTIEWEMLFFLCNVVGTLQRLSETPTYDTDYKRIQPWTAYATNIRATFVEKDLAYMQDNHENIAAVSNVSNVLYVSGVHDVKVGDRLNLAAGRQYQVITVDAFMIENVKVCTVKEDMRG